jgi:hypothetical protein
MAEAISYKIVTEVPSSYMEKLFAFMYTKYLTPQKQRFTNVYREIADGVPYLSYVVLNAQGKQILKVEVKGTLPIDVKLVPIDYAVSAEEMEEAKQDVVIAVQIFEEYARKATLFFAWREGEEIVPETLRKKERSFRRLFLETQILFFVVFIVFGMAVFVAVTIFYPDAIWIAPLVLIAVQFVFVFYSSKFI